MSLGSLGAKTKGMARSALAALRTDRSSETRAQLPHDRTRGLTDVLAQKLGLETGELTKTKTALRSGSAVNKEDVIALVQANADTRSDILRSKLADKVVNLAKSGLDPKQTQILEGGLLAELRSELPLDVALQVSCGAYDTAKSLIAGNPSVGAKIDFYQAISAILESKRTIASLETSDPAYAVEVTKRQRAILNLAETLVDPASKAILDARNHTDLEAIRTNNPARSKHTNALDQLKDGDKFHRAFYDYLDHIGVSKDLSSLRTIIENPYQNKDHPLIQDPTRQGLRLVLVNDIIGRDFHRLRKDTLCPGFLGSLRESLFSSGFEPVQITKSELDEIYGKDKDGRNLNPHQTDYTFRLDRFVIDLMAGKSGAPLSQIHPNYTTKSGAVVQLLEAYAVLEKKYHTSTDKLEKIQIAHQKELLKSLITDESSSLLPPAVYKQVQDVFNNEALAIYPNMTTIAKTMSGKEVKAQIDKEVGFLKAKHTGFGNTLDSTDRLIPEVGNPNDPRSFFVATMTILRNQSKFTATNAANISASIGTHSAEVADALKTNVIKDLLETSTIGVAKPDSLNALFASILDEDKRIAISEERPGEGPLRRLLFNNSQVLNESKLRESIEHGVITPEHVWLDDSGSDRKLMGLAYLLNKIETSSYPDLVKTEAKQKIITAILRDPGKVSATLSAIDTSASQINEVAANVPVVSKMESRSLDSLASLHNIISAHDQSAALFQHNFLKGFSRPVDFTEIQKTWHIIGEVAKTVDTNAPIEEQLQMLAKGLKEHGREALADSVRFMYEPFGNDSQSSMLRVMLDFVKELGFTKFVEGIERFLNVCEQQNYRNN